MGRLRGPQYEKYVQMYYEKYRGVYLVESGFPVIPIHRF